MDGRLECGIFELIGCSVLIIIFFISLVTAYKLMETSFRLSDPTTDGRRLALIICSLLWLQWGIIRWMAAWQFYILGQENHYVNCYYPVVRLVLLIGGALIGFYYGVRYKKFMWLQPAELWIRKTFYKKS